MLFDWLYGQLDKASIVSDAISYVEDLQKQVDEMQADIHTLESGKGSSPQGPCHDSNNGMTPKKASRKQFTEHRILEVTYWLSCVDLSCLGSGSRLFIV